MSVYQVLLLRIQLDDSNFVYGNIDLLSSRNCYDLTCELLLVGFKPLRHAASCCNLDDILIPLGVLGVILDSDSIANLYTV